MFLLKVKHWVVMKESYKVQSDKCQWLSGVNLSFQHSNWVFSSLWLKKTTNNKPSANGSCSSFFPMFCQSSLELIPSPPPTWGMKNRKPQIMYKIPSCSCKVAAQIYSSVYFWVLLALCLYYLFTVYNTLTFSLGIEEYIIYTFWFCQIMSRFMLSERSTTQSS